MTEAAARWQLKGKAPLIYDQYIAPAVSSPWYPLLVDAGNGFLHGTIADIGCGTGSFLTYLANHLASDATLVGVDVNPQMLAVAQDKPKTKKHVQWVQADVKELPFASNQITIAFCQQGVQYFKDKLAAFSEISRVISREGRFVATVWSKIDDCSGYKHLAEVVTRVIGTKAQASLQAPFSFSDPYQLRHLAEASGFSKAHVETKDNYVRFSSVDEFVLKRIFGSPLVDEFPTQDTDHLVDQIISEMKAHLRSYVSSSGLAFPVRANVLIAQK